MDLDDQLEKIKSRADFVAFLHSFRKMLSLQPDECENPTLERYLEAMEAWVMSIEGYVLNSGDNEVLQPSWKTFAKIVSAASIYE